MTTCSLPECQTTGMCAHRGPHGETCFGAFSTQQPALHAQAMWPWARGVAVGCVCPAGANKECNNPTCPRGGRGAPPDDGALARLARERDALLKEMKIIASNCKIPERKLHDVGFLQDCLEFVRLVVRDAIAAVDAKE